MIELKEIVEYTQINNESDFYLKIKIVFGNRYPSTGPICYWSTVGKSGEFIELGLKKINGAMYKITVITMPKIQEMDYVLDESNIVEKSGLPLFNVNSWQTDDGFYIRESTDFDVYAGKSTVSIVFSTSEIVLEVANGSIIFGFDKNNFLCFIKMIGMKLNDEGFLEEIK